MTVEEIAGSISYCGLVCKSCHFLDQCGGCKTAQNSCNKRLSPEGCYQYTCCVSKGLNGCWECAGFPCGEDMFSDGHGPRIKAFVRCIKEEGPEKLAEYLIRNAENGLLYHREGIRGDYDGLDSEEQVLQLLRTGKIG